MPSLKGPVVFGLDDIWGEARSIWNQQTYHINNINDDLSVPVSEFNSWDSHNTYHTQFPGEFVLPIFGVNISHTIGALNQTADRLQRAARRGKCAQLPVELHTDDC